MGANAKRRREAKVARKATGKMGNGYEPTIENLTRIMKRDGLTPRAQRRSGGANR